MTKYLSGKIAAYIVKNDDTADYEELAYGYEVLLHDALVVLALLLIAVPFGLALHVIFLLVVYHLLRGFAGGAHAKSGVVCKVTSVVFLYGIAFLSAKTALRIPVYAIVPLYVLDAALLLLYAPADTEVMPIRNPGVRKSLKIKSVICLSACFGAALLTGSRWASIASILVLTPTLACCFTHPAAYWLYGCKKSNQQTKEVTQ